MRRRRRRAAPCDAVGLLDERHRDPRVERRRRRRDEIGRIHPASGAVPEHQGRPRLPGRMDVDSRGAAWGLELEHLVNNAPMSETLFVVDRPAGSEWTPGKGAREQPLWDEHAAFMDDLFERGLIALGGPFLDGSGAMVVLRVADEAEARALLAPDPWCSDGRDVQGVGRIRPWTIFLDGR